jgi:long-chain acyl-CoA synthetase
MTSPTTVPAQAVLSPDNSVAALLRRWFLARAEQPCLSCDGTTRTWRELGERSSRVAQGLVAAGVGRGDRVSFLDQNGPEYFELFAAAMMAGAVVAPVNWRLAPGELGQVLALAGASLLLVGAGFVDALDAVRDQIPGLAKVVVLGEVPDGRLRAGDERYEVWLARHPAVDPRVPVAADDNAMMMYTSGTTGLPRGVVFGHSGVRQVMARTTVAHVTTGSTVLVTMPVFHALGTSFGLLALGSGAHVVVARQPRPDLLFDLLCRWEVTVTSLVPAVLRAMVEAPEGIKRPLPELQRILYAGSPISPELLRRCLDTFSCGLVQVYGLTETQAGTALLPEDHLDDARPWLLETAGRPVDGNRVRIVDPDGREVGEGETGEVEIWAATSMKGYWNDPVATEAAVRPDGFIRTGDVGHFTDGYLFLRDRIKDMIVSGGENVYPIEVERVLAKCPGAADVAVIGVPSKRWGETVVAVVVRRPGNDELDGAQVIAFCRARLAAYKCPTRVEFRTELPRNPSGKVLRRVLREPYWRDRTRRIG